MAKLIRIRLKIDKDRKIILQAGFASNPFHKVPITVDYFMDTLMTVDHPIEMFLFKVSRNIVNKWVNIILFIANDDTSFWLIAVFITYH